MQTIKNNITLMGNMGINPLITNFDNGRKVARFSLASDVFNESGEKEKTEWHRVFAWGNVAEFIENYGAKGKHLIIHGRVVNRTYVNKSGKERKVTEVEIKHILGI